MTNLNRFLLSRVVAVLVSLTLPTLAHAGWLDNLFGGSVSGEMVLINGGSFNMGSPRYEQGRDDDETLHQVTVNPFYIARHEVTVGQYEKFVAATGYVTDAKRDNGKYGDNGCWSEMPNAMKKRKNNRFGYVANRNWRNPGFINRDGPALVSQRPDHPVVCVSFNDAMAYVEWLRVETGKPFRLPTEAEWEFAARGGTTTPRYWGKDPARACDYANVFDNNSLSNAVYDWPRHDCRDGHTFTAPVGSFKANGYGLKDMLGNVWEWTCSQYANYNPRHGLLGLSGEETRCGSGKSNRSIRGGAWDLQARQRSVC